MRILVYLQSFQAGDRHALETAAAIRDAQKGTEITVLAAGGWRKKGMLKEALAISGGRAWFAPAGIEDEAGAEPQDEMLYAAVRKIEETEGKFDLILIGEQPEETGLFPAGPGFAEAMGYSQMSGVETASADCKTVTAVTVFYGRQRILSAGLPCVLFFGKSGASLRHPTVAGILWATDDKIDMLQCLSLRPLPLKVCRTSKNGGIGRKDGILRRDCQTQQALEDLCLFLEDHEVFHREAGHGEQQ